MPTLAIDKICIEIYLFCAWFWPLLCFRGLLEFFIFFFLGFIWAFLGKFSLDKFLFAKIKFILVVMGCSLLSCTMGASCPLASSSTWIQIISTSRDVFFLFVVHHVLKFSPWRWVVDDAIDNKIVPNLDAFRSKLSNYHHKVLGLVHYGFAIHHLKAEKVACSIFLYTSLFSVVLIL